MGQIGLVEWTTATIKERDAIIDADRMPDRELLDALNACPGDVPDHKCVICENHDTIA